MSCTEYLRAFADARAWFNGARRSELRTSSETPIWS